MTKKVALREGWYKIPERLDDEVYLIGTRCKSCGEVFFPSKHYCMACTSPDVVDTPLGKKGIIDTFTICRMTAPGSVMQAPYVLAKVKLPEGPIVMTVVTDCDPEEVDIGMKVEVVVRKVKADEQGNDVMAYMFRPVQEAR